MSTEIEINGISNIKPGCRITGEDGNIFAVLGRATTSLRDAGQEQKAKELRERVMSSHSYADALNIILEYVQDIDTDDDDDFDDDDDTDDDDYEEQDDDD